MGTFDYTMICLSLFARDSTLVYIYRHHASPLYCAWLLMVVVVLWLAFSFDPVGLNHKMKLALSFVLLCFQLYLMVWYACFDEFWTTRETCSFNSFRDGTSLREICVSNSMSTAVFFAKSLIAYLFHQD